MTDVQPDGTGEKQPISKAEYLVDLGKASIGVDD
ncbi:hypothetical protein ABH944_000972 [Caballeronia udeis]|jgi:hypothetical protein|uniref:Uncharacterized protein n=1 Tax=Caballeronia udeis TaxID=1232866 RepID=A0ABW8MAH5_9BURK